MAVSSRDAITRYYKLAGLFQAHRFLNSLTHIQQGFQPIIFTKRAELLKSHVMLATREIGNTKIGN
ncbi:hypothetical protein OSCI_1190003 [Kamptonema sp. PCC 6506]|nr:hypothetical protein OSCI_1190003 [Kamptonema sp. PCC 6506]